MGPPYLWFWHPPLWRDNCKGLEHLWIWCPQGSWNEFPENQQMTISCSIAYLTIWLQVSNLRKSLRFYWTDSFLQPLQPLLVVSGLWLLSLCLIHHMISSLFWLSYNFKNISSIGDCLPIIFIHVILFPFLVFALLLLF